MEKPELDCWLATDMDGSMFVVKVEATKTSIEELAEMFPNNIYFEARLVSE